MKDLFGQEIPDNPPMDAPLPLVVWKVTTIESDVPEYWAGRTESEVRAAVKDCDLTPVHVGEERNDYALKMLAQILLGAPNHDGPLFICGGDE